MVYLAEKRPEATEKQEEEWEQGLGEMRGASGLKREVDGAEGVIRR